MLWDFAEAYPFGKIGRQLDGAAGVCHRILAALPMI